MSPALRPQLDPALAMERWRLDSALMASIWTVFQCVKSAEEDGWVVLQAGHRHETAGAKAESGIGFKPVREEAAPSSADAIWV